MSKFLFGNYLFYGAVFGLASSLLLYYFLPDFFLLFVHLSTICFYLALLYAFFKFVYKKKKQKPKKEKMEAPQKCCFFWVRFIFFYFSNFDNLWFNLNALSTTDTELKLIAAPAIIGLNNGPPKKCKTPIATGIPITL